MRDHSAFARNALIVGVSVILVGSPAGALAQGIANRPVVFTIGAGVVGQPSASRYHPFGIGLAGVVGVEVGHASLIGLRAEATGMVRLSGGGADSPLCAPGGTCVGRQTADAVTVASLSARLRAPSTPFYALAGMDYVYAPSTFDPGPNSTTGLNAGVGWSMGKGGRRALEARYHAPRRDLGLTKSLVDVTLRFRVGG